MRMYVSYFVLSCVFVLSGCQQQESPEPSGEVTIVSRPKSSDEHVQRGKLVFQKNCAVCHGDKAQGTPNWRKRGADGKYPPPPLDGSAHAWHHSKAILMDIIKRGTIRLGGSMPPWQDKLSDAEIEDIILWLQSQWPDEIYAAWYKLDQESR